MKQRNTYVENPDLDVLMSMIEERGFKVERKRMLLMVPWVKAKKEDKMDSFFLSAAYLNMTLVIVFSDWYNKIITL
jgi:hypothetical protein